MVTNFIVFMAFSLCVLCTALDESSMMQLEKSSDDTFLFYKSPVMRFIKSSDGALFLNESSGMRSGESSDVVSLMRQAANVLNVSVPNGWDSLMQPPTSSGSHGQAHIGESTVSDVLANWTIPESFLQEAIRNVRLLVLAATEGTYSVQTFSFDTRSGSSLTTLLVITTSISAPADPNLPVAVIFITINTNATIKQLYTDWSEKVCERCLECLGIFKCCCHYQKRRTTRGHTIAELNAVRQRMTADQFIWFNEHKLSPNARKRSVSSNNNLNKEKISLTEAIENFLWDKASKAEVLEYYNDSIITAVQTELTSFKTSSQSLELNRVLRKNLPKMLKALAKDHGFENIYSNPKFSQLLESSEYFSFENFFTLPEDGNNSILLIKYIWIIGQLIDNSTCTLYFLSVNATSMNLIERMFLNVITGTNSSRSINKDQRLNIIRTSTFAGTGKFFNEHRLKWITPWQQETTRTILNMLRFTGATVLVPEKFRMLSDFDLAIDSPNAYQSPAQSSAQNITDKILALASSVSKAVAVAKQVIEVLKSSKSVTIQRILQFGFSYFQQRSETLKVIDIPSSQTKKFIKALTLDYNLPSKGALGLALTYSADTIWDRSEYLYSPNANGRYRSLTIFKNGDSVQNTASFFIVDIDADYNLAPDLLLVTESKSYLGGLFSSSKQSHQEIPHVLTIDEAVKLQQFFMVVAMGNVASTLGFNTTSPSTN